MSYVIYAFSIISQMTKMPIEINLILLKSQNKKVCIFQRMPYITDILHLNNDKISVSKGKTLIMDRMTNEKKSRAVGILIFYYISYVIKQALVFLKTQKGESK